MLWRALWLSFLLTAAFPAWGAAHEYSDLEQSVLTDALGERGWELEPEPEGKWIEAVEVERIEVFDDRDPVPNWFNVFHVTSREPVVRRELLFEAGSRYRQERIDETARNLRSIRQLSLVLIVPARGSSPDRVRVLVVTKDIWSLRLNSNFAVGDSGLDFLLLNPSEENLFGQHDSIGLLYVLERDRHTFGARFIQPRLLDSRLRLAASVNVLRNRETFDSEGSYGVFSYSQPLYSIQSKWGWAASVAWRDEITRRFIGAELRTFDVQTSAGLERLPEVYATDRLAGSYEIVRSFGAWHKTDLSLGVEADRRVFRADSLAGFSDEAAAQFRREVLPVSDTRLSPFLQVRSWVADYTPRWNFNTLGLQEDYRLGHDVLLRLYPAATALGSSRDLLGVFAALGYTASLGTGLIRTSVGSRTEFANEARHDALFDAALRIVSPRTDLGRWHLDAILANRHQNYLNSAPFTLGTESRLRGYRVREFQGKDLVAANLEYRTNSVDILSAQVGAAVFYDTGDAFDGFDELTIKQSAGAGVRILFPQADRLVMRGDWGFPLTAGFDTWPGAWTVTFGQAFAMPSIEEPSVTSEVFSE